MNGNQNFHRFVELIEKLLLDDRVQYICYYISELHSIDFIDNALVSELINSVDSVKSLKYNSNNEIMCFALDSLAIYTKEVCNVIELNNSIDKSIEALSNLLANKSTYNLNDDILSTLKNLYLLTLSVAYLNIFIVSNWTGPQIGYVLPSDQVIIDRESKCKKNSESNDSELFNKFLIFGIPNKPLRQLLSQTLDTSIAEQLGIDGEIVYDGVFGITYFHLSKYLLNHVTSSFDNNKLSTLFIWNARMGYIHQSIIRDGHQNYCNSLAKMSIFDYIQSLKQLRLLQNFQIDHFSTTNYQTISHQIEFDNQFKSLLLMELIKHLITFGFNHLVSQVIDEATNILNITVDFTGKLGICRKYQKVPHAQLVVDIKGHSNYHNLSTQVINGKTPNVLHLYELDQDNDIFEVPVFIGDNDELDDSYIRNLTIAEESILLCRCLHLCLNITSDDEIGLEQLNTLASKVLYKTSTDIYNNPDNLNSSSCWSTTTCALWFKSKAEHLKCSKACRAAMQLDELATQFYNTKTEAMYRLKHFHNIYYPSIWDIRREGAKRLLRIGSLISACDLYNELGMYEDSIICMTVAGRRQEAKKLVLELLDKQEHPYLWCSLGDIEVSADHYLKAWVLSNYKYARAQRSLGALYYMKKSYGDSALAFNTSLSINPLNKTSCYTLGCCYLHLCQFDKALEAFSKAIVLDPDMGDVWANMASAHLKLQNYKQAKIALEEAIKRNRSSRKIWDMYLSTCLLIKDVNSVCIAANKLCELGHYDSVKPWAVAFILSQYNPDNIGSTATSRSLDCIRKTFENIISGCNDSDIWDLCAQYSIINNDFNTAIEYTFKQYRVIYNKIVSANDDLVNLALSALLCLQRITKYIDKVDNYNVIAMNTKDNINSLVKHLKNMNIESNEVNNVACQLIQQLNK